MEGGTSLTERIISTGSIYRRRNGGFVDFCILNRKKSTCMLYLNASLPITTKMKAHLFSVKQ